MTVTREFTITGIGQIAVPVHDLERAVGFYRDTLGLPLLFQVPKMAFFDCDGVRLMLSIPDAPEFDHPASIIYYRVADIAGAHGVLSERGLHFEAAPHRVADLGTHELWMAFLRDPDGNVLALMSEVGKAG
jgi:methylmalonyl-CoA/ethylmalonyl-CoA epimerase